MDPKDLRANAPLSISISDDSTKYAHNSPTLPANKSRSYHEIGSTSMGKVDATAVRPCAIIGPDRVLPQTLGDVYLKKAQVEPWSCSGNTYRQPPDYPNRLSDYPQIRNISPRQTFQENMQRVMVPPNYNSIKNGDDNSSLKNPKSNMPQEAKYCDVPYNMNSVTNELKSVRNTDIPMPSVNPSYGRSVPHYGWPGGVNIRPQRPYGAPEMYQYPEYPSCVGPRPVTLTHPHRIHSEETAQVYSERLYQEANIRFKPYPTIKEKHQQSRYDYINNYQNSFHPPVTFPPHKYDLQKSLQTHPYPMYSQVPLKYLDRRIHETFIDGYQRSNQQPNFNPQFHNQLIHPPYGPISGNCVQNRSCTDLSGKTMTINKIPHETNNKTYFELDPSRNKGYPVPENVYYNDNNHTQHLRGEILLPNQSKINMHSMQQHQIYRRDNIKHYEYNPHYRHLDQSANLNYSLPRLPLQYSPNMVAISPSDSNTSNDTTHTIGTSQEDCGYVSQSSTNSVRSLDAVSKEMYRRHDYNIHAINRNISSSDKSVKNKNSSLSKKNINVRQFLQMWNEGEDDTNEYNKETVQQIHTSDFTISSQTIDNQEQLYILGSVNVSNEDLSKYEHIQKISRLPENIKGYNSIELLNQYEELLETPNINNYKVIPKVYTDHSSITKRPNEKENITLPRPVSPLDVEAKISQSVIHKEVGCNFEIKPCSPEMLHVEVATPIQNILGERIIEKISNPITSKSPILSRNDDNKPHNSDINNIKIASCDIINKEYPVNNYANINKNDNYNVQDFESNSGISLASLPRLDNDIELNFPEINQQFIKANNIDTDAHLFTKDLTQLNMDETTQEKSSYLQQNSLSPQFHLGSAPEKEFSKLSKYRKSKKCDMVPKDNSIERNTVTVQQRINSVIIKNPDTKLQEESAASFTTSNKTSAENVDYNYTEQDHEKLFSSLKTENSKEKQMSFETAIDFSLNKSETNIPYDCLNNSTDESHNSGDKHNIIYREKYKENISKEQPLELHLKQIIDHETIQENMDKESLEFNKCADKPRYSEKSHSTSFSSDIEREIISKEQPQELYLKQIRDYEAMEENISNNELLEHSEHINEQHCSENSHNISNRSEMEITSREQTEELLQKQIQDHETIKEKNIYKEQIENSENHIDENTVITQKSYDDIIKSSVETHCFEDKHDIGFNNEIEKEIISMQQSKSEELHLQPVSDKETIIENITINIEPLEHSEIQVKQKTASITYNSYDCLNNYPDEPHPSDDSHDICISSADDKDIISKDQHLKPNEDHEMVQKNIINKATTENSETQDNINNASEACKQPINVLGKENNTPDVKNISIITELKDYANTEENTTCIGRPEDDSILKSSTIIKSVDTEKINKVETVTIIGTVSHVKKQETSLQFRIKSSLLHDNFKDNKNHELCECKEEDKNCNKPKVSKEYNEISKVTELFIISEKDGNISPIVENTAIESMRSDDIEIKMNEENIASSTGPNKELQFTKVLDEIEKNEELHNKKEDILKMLVNFDRIETETCMALHSTDDLSLKNQPKEINKITDEDCYLSDNMVPKVNESTFNNDRNDFDQVRNQETNNEEEIIAKISDIECSNSKAHKSNSDNKSLVDTKNVLNELSDGSQDENFNCKEINLFSLKNDESICRNDFTSSIENKINTNYISNLNTKFKEKPINKELLSPWIQKLIIFEEGICANMQSKAIGTKSTYVGISFNPTDVIFNKYLENEANYDQKNLLRLENRTKNIQKNCSDETNFEKNLNECNKNFLTNDLIILSEDKNSNIEKNQTVIKSVCHFRQNILKRSLSESALEDYKDDENGDSFVPNKRKKKNHNIIHPVISEDLCSIIQTNRRNSISTFYNDDNVFILIDNDLIITEENDDSDKMFFTEMSHEFANNIPQNDCIVDDTKITLISEMNSVQSDLIYEEKPIQDSWVEDVACIETVVSDDITDDIDYGVASPIKYNTNDETISDQLEFCDNKHIDKIKNTYRINMCSNDTEILKTLYMTPQMNVNKTLLEIESHSAKYLEFNKTEELPSKNNDYLDKIDNKILTYNNYEVINEKENINTKDIKKVQSDDINNEVYVHVTREFPHEKEKFTMHSNSYESNGDSILQSPKRTISNYLNSSSPEVSSTTPEEKNSNIVLKITNNNNSRISNVNEIDSFERLTYKLTENKDYQNYNTNFRSSRTLITKAAQKYIPPLKESIRDLKIKLTLPQHRLQTLKQLKVSKMEPKIDNNIINYTNKNTIPQTPKKNKPKFEDVLKSIDEIQFKKHKDKIKKGKNGIPKVVIKKNENGAHFASCKTTKDKESYNPDLTGRKWQPWVFLEKNNFIDKMAIRNKVRAVYCHRKNNYVLAEKFRKYKSIYNANFVISQPCPNNSVKGTLKYTIRLKHK
ncbi:unnamed protein product [Euphydryas editha]|uniref:C2H2-type domain-containing protein n=1 Tax=Euphydryas editha TaxID=104508 RepID=A0AAU9UTU9_EUPED|nr:unnamed protein product [Euphydryas editha]